MKLLDTPGVRRSARRGPTGEKQADAVRDVATADAGHRGPDATWPIGELASELGVTTRTIRFYEARGLIAPARDNGARVYGRRDRARLLLIMRGKNLGFTLEDIRQYLSLYDSDPSQVVQTQMLLQKVEGSIADLEHKRVDLERTLSELKGLRDRAMEFLRQRER